MDVRFKKWGYGFLLYDGVCFAPIAHGREEARAQQGVKIERCDDGFRLVYKSNMPVAPSALTASTCRLKMQFHGYKSRGPPHMPICWLSLPFGTFRLEIS